MPEELHDMLRLITLVEAKREQLSANNGAAAACDALLRSLYRELQWAAAGYLETGEGPGPPPDAPSL
ncbi:MAG: hypothetical protein CL878_09090 [Dehalococcoidia bacterium]|nr:hypothetical protein [Dehalococcoidia bacterium]